jgi:phosphate transport system protein
MVRHFEEELNRLKERLLHMSDLVTIMIDDAIRLLVERNSDFSNEVNKHEDEVNKIQIEIDDRCLTLIALQQPAAADLRFITSAMKINSDLERMGDQAINITESAQKLLDFPSNAKIIDRLEGMSKKVREMVKSALDAFIGKDMKLAQSVLLRDDEVDDMKDELFRDLLQSMADDTANVQRSLGFILISRNLERIGDHSTNISEDVIFMVCGKDIRHHIADNR